MTKNKLSAFRVEADLRKNIMEVTNASKNPEFDILALPEGKLLCKQLESLYMKNFLSISSGKELISRTAEDSLDLKRSKAHLDLCEKITGLKLAGKRMLEVGAGIGMTTATAKLYYGADVTGLEPSEDEYSLSLEISRELFRILGLDSSLIVRGTGENIPFQDNSFDIVYSSNVLEHVDDPEKVCSEIVRVLKPGGTFHVIIPNYGSLWEGHYGLFWIPHMPKALAKIYVRLWGRDPKFIDTLQFITRGRMEKAFKKLADKARVESYGQEIWVERLQKLDVPAYASLPVLAKFVKLVSKLKLISAFTSAGKFFHWETPLIITGKKL